MIKKTKKQTSKRLSLPKQKRRLSLRKKLLNLKNQLQKRRL